jgi:ferredoxin
VDLQLRADVVNIPGLPDFTDRRALFKSSVGKWLEDTLEKAERRVAPERYLRPPGALPEVAFLAACTRCGECITACPPFAIQACVVCESIPCARACPTEALTLPPDGWRGYRLAALELVPERCVTFAGTPCRACADACPVGERALVMDDDGHPVLKAEGCVGCGVCVRACITSPSSFVLHSLEG